jgi:CRP/FNR family transcriptional regulator, cyclic AMP receptor protein
MEKFDLARAREILGRQRWLHDHGADLVEPLLTHGRLVSFQPGTWTHAEGDEDTGLLIVIRGSVHILCKAPGERQVLLGPIRAGGAMGQTSRFGGGPRLVTVQCVENSLILLASDRALAQIATTRPQIWEAVAALAYQLTRDLVQLLAEAIALPPRQRIAARMVRLAREEDEGGKPVLCLSQEVLAEMVGLTRKTVNGYFAEFERKGLIRRTYASTILLDPSGLRRIAES